MVEGGLPFGELLERGTTLLADTRPGVVRLDDASSGLLAARFEVEGVQGQRTLEHERLDGEAPRTLLGQITPFVGRDRELNQLEIIFREVVEESIGRAVVVSAPAGAGKSRLRYEFVQRLSRAHEQFTLLSARGDSVHSATPFGVLAPALRSWAEIAGNDCHRAQA